MNYDLSRPHINMYFTVLSLHYYVLWREDTVQVTFFRSTLTFFFLNHRESEALFSVCVPDNMTNELKWNNIVW